MNVGKTLFAQLMDFLPWKTFHRIAVRYDGDYRIRTLSCAEHFRVLAFAQLTYRVKRFYGTSENAVKTQIWTAVSVYVLVAIVKKRLHLDISLYTLLKILSVTPFEQIPLNKDFPDAKYSSDNDVHHNQLALFDS